MHLPLFLLIVAFLPTRINVSEADERNYQRCHCNNFVKNTNASQTFRIRRVFCTQSSSPPTSSFEYIISPFSSVWRKMPNLLQRVRMGANLTPQNICRPLRGTAILTGKAKGPCEKVAGYHSLTVLDKRPHRPAIRKVILFSKGKYIAFSNVHRHDPWKQPVTAWVNAVCFNGNRKITPRKISTRL